MTQRVSGQSFRILLQTSAGAALTGAPTTQQIHLTRSGTVEYDVVEGGRTITYEITDPDFFNLLRVLGGTNASFNNNQLALVSGRP